MYILGIAVLVIAAVVIFSVQNAAPVSVAFLTWKFGASLAVIVFLVFVIGISDERSLFHLFSYSFNVCMLHVSNDSKPLPMEPISAIHHFFNRVFFRPSLLYHSKHRDHNTRSIRAIRTVY